MVSRIQNWVIFFFLLSAGYSADKLALTMKAKGDARLRAIQTEKVQTLNRGVPLFNGDLILTGEDGLAIILFLDDKTQLKIKENSETEITGTRGKKNISKRVNMAYGSMKASIEKQKGAFVVVTPTSIASVKGTEFWLFSNPDSGDVLIGLSGDVELTNSITGATMTVRAGTVFESTPDGEITELITVKVSGEATSGISGGRVTLTNIDLINGDIGGGTLSGTIEISDNTIFEGATIESGLIVTVTGTYDVETGNVTATLIEVSEPITIEGTASSSVSGNVFSISDVVLVSGETESLPTSVKLTENTVVTGGDIIMGANVTVTGNYNEETGIIEAMEILVVIPELKISGLITSFSEGEIDVTNIVVIDGDISEDLLSGKILITDATTIEGEFALGVKVIVEGTYNEETGDITAQRITVSQVVILAVANSPVVNNTFEIMDISVVEGDLDPSTLSGIVKLSPDIEIEGGDVTPGVQVTLKGNIDETTGNFLATKVVVIISERELLFEMEDNQGKRLEFIIKFQ